MQMLMANDTLVIHADKKTPQQYHDMSKYAASGWHCKATCGSQRAATKRLRHKHRKLKHKAVFYSVSFWFYMPQECWSLCHSKAEKPSWQLYGATIKLAVRKTVLSAFQRCKYLWSASPDIVKSRWYYITNPLGI